MRKLVYKLADGTVVKTLAEAKASKQDYKDIVITIEREFDDSNLSDSQRARRRRLVWLKREINYD